MYASPTAASSQARTGRAGWWWLFALCGFAAFLLSCSVDFSHWISPVTLPPSSFPHPWMSGGTVGRSLSLRLCHLNLTWRNWTRRLLEEGSGGRGAAGSRYRDYTTTSQSIPSLKMEYPSPRRDEGVVEEFFGIKVADPYRWMEDPDAEETKKFVEQQNAITQPFLNECPNKRVINETLTKLWNYPKYGVTHKEGQRYFFSKNSGLQNQSVMYQQKSLDDEPRVFLDPNLLSDDGTISLATTSFSEDGATFAYGLSASGSDWFKVYFKNVATGEDYPEVLTNVKFSGVVWTHDNKGVFYGCYPDHGADGKDTPALSNQKLFYHRVGTPQSDDVLCVQFPDEPKWRVDSEVSDCGRYLVVCPKQDCRDNLVFFADLQQLSNGIEGPIPLTQIIFKLENDFSYVTNTKSKFVFRTNKNAPNYHLISIDLENPDESNWSVLIKEDSKNVLEWATCVNEKFLVICYMEDVKNTLKVYDLESGSYLFDFPLAIGAVVGFSGKKTQTELFFKFSSMITPGIIYRVNMEEKSPVPKVFLETEIAGFDPNDFQVEQVFYPSKDGTQIPMFIASRKDEKKDGTSPCLLYGYGGFNVSLTPSFAISELFFMRHFGYMAIPNIRGGGEYGENWHNGGRLLKKQNVFDDFHGAAEYLFKNGYTCKEKLAIKGGSNGGLLVGACINQRPELFGAAISVVGVMDMLRFHKFTIGYAWCSDYGNPDEKEHFTNLLTYSPLHNIKVPEDNIQYPSVLLTTGDHDDRVVPSHSLKFAAELQHVMRNVPKQTNPLLIRVETKAGHGAGKPTSKSIEEITDVFCFLVQSLGYKFK